MAKKGKRKRRSKLEIQSDNWVRGRHPSEPLQIIVDPIHGDDGHIGFRCYACAQISDTSILLADDSVDYWQNLQLNWQEQCDLLQNKYDNDIASHFPNHVAIGCEECPKPYAMPLKPIAPAERAFKQNAQ